jgi:hypothetical protein
MLHLPRRVPPPRTIRTNNIEIPQQTAKDKSHLHVTEMSSNAPTWSEREGLHSFLVVTRVLVADPALGDEFVAVLEVLWVVRCGPGIYGDRGSLDDPVSVNVGAAFWDGAEQACGHGRVAAQPFFETGLEVG